MIELRALGGLDLRDAEGEPLDRVLAKPKLLALLVYLAVATPRGFRPRDELLALFWPESDTRHGRASLRKALHRLRQALGKEALETRGDEVRVAPGSLWCDAVAFDEALEEGDHQAALELYRGDLLAAFHLSGAGGFERWMDLERTRLRRLAVATARKRSEAEEEAGNPLGAARHARLAVRIDPFDESSLRRLVRVLDRGGDRSGALRAYEDFARRLEAEYGVEPAAETVALIRELRDRREPYGEPEARPAGSTRSAAPEEEPTLRAIRGGEEEGLPDEGGAGEGGGAGEEDGRQEGPTSGEGEGAGVVEPAGLRDGVPAGAAAGPPRSRRRPLRKAAAVLLAATLGLASAYGLARTFDRKQVAAADAGAEEAEGGPRVAVFPFRVVGSDSELWREGMMDLLSTSLAGIEGLRPVDPHALVTLWDRPEGPGDADEAAIRRIARELSARWAVSGSLADLGERLRLSASVHDVSGTARLGPIVVDGPADSLYSMVDRLTVGLLDAGVLPSDRHLPPVDLRRITTRSLPALKAYLTGERAFRRARWEEAIQAFNDAVNADSTFALAYYRLAVSHDRIGPRWRALDYAQKAARHAERLPAREALLVRARAAMARGEVEALDTYRELLALDPEWEYGWFGLGEALLFVGPQRLHPPSDGRDALNRAIELDPYFAPAYNHLVEYAFWRSDSVEAERLVDGLRRIDETSSTCVGYATARDLAWGTPEEKARRIAALDTMSGARYKPLSCAASVLHLSPLHREAMEPVVTSWTRPHRPLEDRKRVRWPVLMQRLEGGALDEAEEVLDDYAADPASAPFSATIDLLIRTAGLPLDRPVERALAPLEAEGSPDSHFWLGAWAAHRGRPDEVARRVAEIRAAAADSTIVDGGDGPTAEDLRILARTLEGFALLRRGSVEGARELEALLPRIRGPFTSIPLPMFVNYELGDWYLERGDAERARLHLEALDYWAAHYLPLADLRLGRANEALGRPARAREHFARVARWLERADPDVQPLRREALSALARLREE